MKKFRSIVAMILCIATIATVFASCQGPSNAGTNNDEKIQAEADKELQFLRSGLDRNDTSNPTIKALEKFQSDYNREVTYVNCGYNEWNQKVMASIAAGDPIDVVNASTYEYPKFAMKKYTQPINDYVNLKSDYIDIPVMENLFSYGGKFYNASPKGCSLPLIIYYNKTLFENEGIEDPMDLYKKDQWTLDKFKEIAIHFTRDTNSDNITDMWGLAAWYQWVFFGGSAASVCKINDQGLYELNMDNNPNLVEALEFIQSGWNKDKWIGLDGSDIYESFYKQKNAMINEFTWGGTSILDAKAEGRFAFDVGAAPFPYGKFNTEKLNYCFSDGFSILNGADAPYSSGKLIDMILEQTVVDSAAKEDSIPKEWRDLYAELREKPFNSSYYDSAIDSGKELCGKVGDGTDIQQALEMYKPRYQAQLIEANKIPQDKVERDFTTIDLNFAAGIDSVAKASDTASLALSQDNGALKVEMKTATYGELCPAFKTIPSKNPVWGYKKYKVSFEYKVEDIANPDITCYFFEIGNEGMENGRTIFAPDPAAIDGFVAGEVEIEGVADNSEDMFLSLTGNYANTIWFKNLKIEEIK